MYACIWSFKTHFRKKMVQELPNFLTTSLNNVKSLTHAMS